MKIAASALVLAAVLQFSAARAQAQHYSLQHFDDLTFAAMSDARALHWEIYNDFAQSRDRIHLLEDVRSLTIDLQNLERSIHLGRSPRILDRDLDAVLEGVAELKEHLLGCDFAMHRPAQYQGNSNGYVFAPETKHGGRVHVDHAVEMLMGIDRKLNELHQEIATISAAPGGPQIPHGVPPVYQPVPAGPAPLPGPGFPSSWYGPKLPIGHGQIQIQVKK